MMIVLVKMVVGGDGDAVASDGWVSEDGAW